MDFYTHIDIRGNSILYRGWRHGQRQHTRIPFSPTLYIPANADSGDTGLRTIHGSPVEPIQFGDINEAREFVEQFKDVSNYPVYGNTNYIYQYLYKEFPHEVDYDPQHLRIATIDIETSCENGFPDADSPDEKIIAITVTQGDKTYVFGLGEFTIDGDGITAIPYDDEREMLEAFIALWKSLDPDIVTGWNIRGFDIPYLVARLNRLEDGWANSLSPWGRLREVIVNRMGRDQKTYTISGISTLDYYELYQKFTYVKQESYALNHIAKVELGEEKLSYAEYDTIQDFYTQNFQKFVEYNVQDVRLVDRLESKLKLLELAIALAYSARVNFEDVFSQVRTWDAIIHHHLLSKGMVIPQKKQQRKDDQYAGAFVKDPLIGKHDWVVSFDLNSLYPHLIMQYNISPETKAGSDCGFTRGCITPEAVLRGEANASDAPVCVAANGVGFIRDRRGFLPELMDTMYAERKRFKGLMIDAQQRLEALPKTAHPSERRKIEYEISKYKNFQLVRKIQLNSAYGAIGNEYFRFFDVELAEAITLSGQLSIQWIGNALNRLLNRILKTEGEDYVIASDTDSVYLRLGSVVESGLGSNHTPNETVDFLHGFCERVLQPFIDKEFGKLAALLNAYENRMVMDREVIAEKGVWTAKKRYMLSVWDAEGVRYSTPKLKIMGLETARSSTPAYVRSALKRAVQIVLTGTEEQLQEFVLQTEQEFEQLPVEEIAFPRSVSGMDEYASPETVFRKATPIAVKAALIHNHLLKTHKVTRKYRAIGEGEKMKFVYLKTPNPIHQTVIGFTTTLPKEFGICKYVDSRMQFQKSFIEPLRSVTDAIGWSHEKQNSLESLFG